jgi:hypothetical protein
LTTPVIGLVSVPWSQRSGVAAVSQASIPGTVVHVPVAFQVTELALDCTADEGAAQNCVPSVDPPAV